MGYRRFLPNIKPMANVGPILLLKYLYTFQNFDPFKDKEEEFPHASISN